MKRGEFHRALFDGLSRRLGVGVVLTNPKGRIDWISAWVEREFPGAFTAGEPFPHLPLAESDARRESREGAESTSGEPASESAPARESPTDFPHPATGRNGHRYYRHLEFPLAEESEEADPTRVHCLLDITEERNLENTFRDNLRQLTSMKEIIDTLYESVSTREVLFLILVAVTSQMGFGFNRAFYLAARGQRLRGKIGIGPSSAEDAHRIWGRLERIRLPTLRSIYEDLTQGGSTPDPQTQKIASEMDYSLRPGEGGIMEAIESRKPAIVASDPTLPEGDRTLFKLLESDVIAVVPLYVRESLAGVLIADNFITRKPIGEEALELLKTFSGYAGVALERSQLYDELRESVSKLQAANERLKSHQHKLLQAEKLSAIGELAGFVSHEIRNPMVAIGGLARSLLKQDELSPDTRQVLEIIVTEVGRLEKFLKETLDFVKPEVLGTHSVDLREEVAACVSPFRAEFDEREIALSVDVGDTPLRCLIDPDLLHRALSNLFKNAIEAIGRDGEIHVGTRIDDFSATLEICDSGPGIPEDLRPRVFEPFFTTKQEGTGLGLAIAAQSVRSLGGEISLQESDRYKTIFSISLPLEEATAKELAVKRA